MTQLLKADHPRAIDRYIDFFGDGTTTVSNPLGPRTPPADRLTDRLWRRSP
jgi:hypothetical protein